MLVLTRQLGYKNIALGMGTGYQITTGDNNICIGTGAGPLSRK